MKIPVILPVDKAVANAWHSGFSRRQPVEQVFWRIRTNTFRSMDRPALKRDLRLDYDHVVRYGIRPALKKNLWVLVSATMQCLPLVERGIQNVCQ